ncbi:hypothetical protein [Acidovorax sp.]
MACPRAQRLDAQVDEVGRPAYFTTANASAEVASSADRPVPRLQRA